jgi:predicted esterase
MALYLALFRLDFNVKGVFNLSGSPLDFPIRNFDLPMFNYNAKRDPIFKYERALTIYKERFDNVVEYELHSEDIDEHGISNGEIQMLRDWLEQITINAPRL